MIYLVKNMGSRYLLNLKHCLNITMDVLKVLNEFLLDFRHSQLPSIQKLKKKIIAYTMSPVIESIFSGDGHVRLRQVCCNGTTFNNARLK